MGDNSALVTGLLLIAASPLLLGIMLVLGVFAFGAMLELIASPVVIAAVMLLLALFYAADKLSVMSVVFTGAAAGLAFWLWGLIQFYNSPVGQLCQIPFIGQLVCGAGSLGSFVTALPGYLIGGLVLSFLIGGFLLILKK